MKDNDLLMIILAFVFGFMLQGMMKNMCGGRLVEGILGFATEGDGCKDYTDCPSGAHCNTSKPQKGFFCDLGTCTYSQPPDGGWPDPDQGCDAKGMSYI
jgi:hypothetical protein